MNWYGTEALRCWRRQLRFMARNIYSPIAPLTPAVAEKFMNQIRWWEDYARRHDSTIDNNPSVGNKEGGLTTIYEKSLGSFSQGWTIPAHGGL